MKKYFLILSLILLSLNGCAKKEVEKDICQEAAQYFESDLEHADTLLDKEKDTGFCVSKQDGFFNA